MASTARSYAAGSASEGIVARTAPGRLGEAISTGAPPLTGNRTRVPSRLISAAVARWHTSVASWPAAATLVANSEP
jgi:hypothetical protein